MKSKLLYSTTKSLVITLTISLGLAIIPSYRQTVLAQLENYQEQNNEVNSFYGENPFGNFNPSDLIHRATTGPSRSMQDFNNDSQDNIQREASEFKRQREALFSSQSASPTQPKDTQD